MSRTLSVLLRDTALHVVLLSEGADAPATHVWRAHCAALVEQLKQSLRDADYDEATVARAGLAQCALLDDTALRYLPPAQRGEWARELLQQRFHGVQAASSLVYADIEALLCQTVPSTELVALYRGVLGLGLGLTGDGEASGARRERLLKALDRMRKPWTESTEAAAAEPLAFHAGRREADAARAPKLYAGTALGLLATVALWFVLDTQLQRTVHHAIALAAIEYAQPGGGRP